MARIIENRLYSIAIGKQITVNHVKLTQYDYEWHQFYGNGSYFDQC